MECQQVPVGALVLIARRNLSLHTLDVWDFSASPIWPLVLIWHRRVLLLAQAGLIGEVPPGFDRARSCRRGLMGQSSC